jgi:hypothetical protein
MKRFALEEKAASTQQSQSSSTTTSSSSSTTTTVSVPEWTGGIPTSFGCPATFSKLKDLFATLAPVSVMSF